LNVKDSMSEVEVNVDELVTVRLQAEKHRLLEIVNELVFDKGSSASVTFDDLSRVIFKWCNS
jgi:hypothetical protein